MILREVLRLDSQSAKGPSFFCSPLTGSKALQQRLPSQSPCQQICLTVGKRPALRHPEAHPIASIMLLKPDGFTYGIVGEAMQVPFTDIQDVYNQRTAAGQLRPEMPCFSAMHNGMGPLWLILILQGFQAGWLMH